MKCYMGHFGELSKTSPDELLAKINSIDKLISSNNDAIITLNKNLDSLQKLLSKAQNSDLPTVDRIIARIMELGRIADGKMRDFNKKKIGGNIWSGF